MWDSDWLGADGKTAADIGISFLTHIDVAEVFLLDTWISQHGIDAGQVDSNTLHNLRGRDMESGPYPMPSQLLPPHWSIFEILKSTHWLVASGLWKLTGNFSPVLKKLATKQCYDCPYLQKCALLRPDYCTTLHQPHPSSHMGPSNFKLTTVARSMAKQPSLSEPDLAKLPSSHSPPPTVHSIARKKSAMDSTKIGWIWNRHNTNSHRLWLRGLAHTDS